MMKRRLLIGNTFSLTLIRDARVVIEPFSRSALAEKLSGTEIASFWGHENTRTAAEALLGVSLAPKTQRPAIRLSPDHLPMLDGHRFHECFVVSPDYAPGYRPVSTQEVPASAIHGWHILKLTWLPANAPIQGNDSNIITKGLE